jgi:hypothetical protein
MKIQGCDNCRYLWQYNILSCNDLYFCYNIAQPFATNDKFMPTEHIPDNTINYTTTILSFVAITVRSCNKSKYYSNNKKFDTEILFLAMNLVDCRNKIFLWQYYLYISQLFKILVAITHISYNKKFHVAVRYMAIDQFSSSDG